MTAEGEGSFKLGRHKLVVTGLDPLLKKINHGLVIPPCGHETGKEAEADIIVH